MKVLRTLIALFVIGTATVKAQKSAGTVLVIIIPRQYFNDRELIWHDKIERVVF